jgi:hypothetical protein
MGLAESNSSGTLESIFFFYSDSWVSGGEKRYDWNLVIDEIKGECKVELYQKLPE